MTLVGRDRPRWTESGPPPGIEQSPLPPGTIGLLAQPLGALGVTLGGTSRWSIAAA